MWRRILFLLLWCGSAFGSFAQDGDPNGGQPAPQLPQIPEVRKSAARQGIDAKRTILNLESEEAGPRSREFLRTDSSYYVGWMVEGFFKFNRAADYLGYKAAAVSFEHALGNLERDYAKQLRTRTKDVLTYISIYPFQVDYGLITYNLVQSYLNIDSPMAAYRTLRRYGKWNFQKDFLDVYNQLMWVTHRNRFYTTAQYPFLKASIAENEALAGRYLDTSLRRIAQQEAYNKPIFSISTAKQEKLGVYHYKAILASYAFQIDSAQRYYDLMAAGGQPSANNYASFRAITGDFRTAEASYATASFSDGGDRRLQEWAYYSTILSIYKGKPKEGLRMIEDQIKSAGSTPGYGWYQIARARCLAYDGQVSAAEKAIAKAAVFKEVHIGTTLGQSHYDFSVQLEKLVAAQKRWDMLKFENRDWWYNPKVLLKLAQQTAVLGLQRFLIINQFAQNPERDRVIYKLFSTESTVAWDEIWPLISGFSTRFFLQRFQKEIKEDNRPRIRKYFRYFAARLLMKEEKWEEARRMLQSVTTTDAASDLEYEKLLFARKEEALALIAGEQKDDREQNRAALQSAEWFPQLAPFSGLQLPVKLVLSGAVDQKLLSRLKACNIDFSPTGSALEARLDFQVAGAGVNRIVYSTYAASGNLLVAQQSCTYKTASPEAAAVEMAYRMFGVGGNVPAE